MLNVREQTIECLKAYVHGRNPYKYMSTIPHVVDTLFCWFLDFFGRPIQDEATLPQRIEAIGDLPFHMLQKLCKEILSNEDDLNELLIQSGIDPLEDPYEEKQ